MNTKSLLPLGLLLFSSAISAQQLERQVIAAAGNSSDSHSFTIGEVIVRSDNLEVTAGFQQPTFMEDETPPVGITDITGEINVYPVPATNVVTISGTDFNEVTTRVRLYNLEGKRMEFSTERSENTIKLDLGRLSSGTYYLTLINETNNTIAKYKILKMK